MKKIVLRKVSADVQRLIEARCDAQSLSVEAAVQEILEYAATEFAIQHDVALLESWDRDEEKHAPAAETAHSQCGGNARHLVICCHGSLQFRQ